MRFVRSLITNQFYTFNPVRFERSPITNQFYTFNPVRFERSAVTNQFYTFNPVRFERSPFTSSCEGGKEKKGKKQEKEAEKSLNGSKFDAFICQCQFSE